MTGVIIASQDTANSPGDQVKPDAPLLQYVDAADIETYDIFGARTQNPFVPETEAQTGETIDSFFEDFYNRIHLVPVQIDLGNVTSGVSQQVFLWNAFLTDKNMTSFQPPADTGLTLTGQTAPFTIPALAELLYTLDVQANGPPTIDDSAEWVIDGETITLTITGNRIVQFLFPPNWNAGLKETLSWLTNIITSFSGSEQRRQIRGKPRKDIEYSVMLTGSDLRMLQNSLFGWQNRLFAVPVWQDRARLTSPATAGDTNISLVTDYRAFVPEGLGVITNGIDDFELIQIGTVTPTTLILNKPLSNDWIVGSKVYPVVSARMREDVPTSRLSSNVMQTTVNMAVDGPALELPDLPPDMTYDGYEVITRKPNWIVPMQYDNLFPRLEFDSMSGPVVSQPSQDLPSQRSRVQWLLENKEDVWWFKGLLRRLGGRWKAELVPTWLPDFKALQLIANGATTIFADSPGYEVMSGVNEVQEYILVRNRGGSYFAVHTITGVNANLGGEGIAIGVTPPIGAEISPDEAVLSIVHKCRLSSDSVTINYQTNGVAVVELTMQSVKA